MPSVLLSRAMPNTYERTTLRAITIPPAQVEVRYIVALTSRSGQRHIVEAASWEEVALVKKQATPTDRVEIYVRMGSGL